MSTFETLDRHSSSSANRMFYPRPSNQQSLSTVFSKQSFTLLNDIYLNLAVQLLVINAAKQQAEDQQQPPPQNCHHHCPPRHHQNHYQYRQAQQQHCTAQPASVFDHHIANVSKSLQQIQQMRAEQRTYNTCMQLYSHYMSDVAHNINDYLIMREVNLYNGRILEKYEDYFVVEDVNQNRHTILRNA